MNKLDFSGTTTFEELPLAHFDEMKFSVYVLNPEWKYLFVNKFVKENLGSRSYDILGKNMWATFPELAADPSFIQLKTNMEKGLISSFITISPLTSQRLNITGHPLKDCYFFTSSILPKKEDLINELRQSLRRS